VFDTADYELVWPRGVFAREVAALLAASSSRGDWSEAVELLLEEAFAGALPAEEFRHADGDNPWGGGPSGAAAFLTRLYEAAPTLRVSEAPRAYWSQRHGRARQAAAPAAPNYDQLAGWFL